ncbi:uncharacterized protein LOC113791486 [Dermatophagoides pteronyssinus]|uniref:uncharacterized protein LOC113791486 n=1 Tax=Dermatophagoides pteronyssinus TaxID=6956 RepID=UPI003F674675
MEQEFIFKYQFQVDKMFNLNPFERKKGKPLTMLSLIFFLIIFSSTTLTQKIDVDCTNFIKSALNKILLIGMINNEQLLLITTDSKVYRISYNDNPTTGDISFPLTNPLTIMDIYPILYNDQKFKRIFQQNLIRNSFIFKWRSRLRMIFIADDTIEYYPDWLLVETNRFRLPSIETIPLSIYENDGSILYILNIQSTELKIQSIYLQAIPCEIFDMDNILYDNQYRYICFSSSQNTIFIEPSIEKRCISPVKLLVRMGFITNTNVYLITEKYVYFFSKNALINLGSDHRFYKIEMTSFFRCKEKGSKPPIEKVNKDEPIYEDHWKPKDTKKNQNEKTYDEGKPFDFNLNYLWIVLVVVAIMFLSIICYIRQLIHKRKTIRMDKYKHSRLSSSIISSEIPRSSSRLDSMRTKRSSMMSRLLHSSLFPNRASRASIVDSRRSSPSSSRIGQKSSRRSSPSRSPSSGRSTGSYFQSRRKSSRR